jgi:hypothetical protein
MSGYQAGSAIYGLSTVIQLQRIAPPLPFTLSPTSPGVYLLLEIYYLPQGRINIASPNE